VDSPRQLRYGITPKTPSMSAPTRPGVSRDCEGRLQDSVHADLSQRMKQGRQESDLVSAMARMAWLPHRRLRRRRTRAVDGRHRGYAQRTRRRRLWPRMAQGGAARETSQYLARLIASLRRAHRQKYPSAAASGDRRPLAAASPSARGPSDRFVSAVMTVWVGEIPCAMSSSRKATAKNRNGPHLRSATDQGGKSIDSYQS